MNSIQRAEASSMMSKVPEVTIYFWIIKILCTTVGETASDFLNINLNLGLTGTSIVMGALLLIVLFFQFRAKEYKPSFYWSTVVLISIFGTLVTDNMTDKMGILLEASTIFFSIALALTFIIWHLFERTLSIHSIFTIRRESFYWLAILFTFALGTASGDLMAERLGLGYLVTGIIICAVVASVTLAWRIGLDSVLSFWIAYIMTRPLGASLGDFISQAKTNGGLGLGATITSAIFLAAILLTVVFLSITRMDKIAGLSKVSADNKKVISVRLQVASVLSVLIIIAVFGYQWQLAKLKTPVKAIKETTSSKLASPPLGDLSMFKEITENTLSFVHNGKLAAAKSRIGDLEYAWDNSEAKLRPMNPEKWKEVDRAIDFALRQLRAVRQDSAACSASLDSLIEILNKLDL